MTLQVRTPEAVAALAQPGGAPEEPAQGGTPRVAADAPIAQIAGSRLPKYSFAAGAPGGVPRIGKAGGSEKAAGDRWGDAGGGGWGCGSKLGVRGARARRSLASKHRWCGRRARAAAAAAVAVVAEAQRWRRRRWQ